MAFFLSISNLYSTSTLFPTATHQRNALKSPSIYPTAPLPSTPSSSPSPTTKLQSPPLRDANVDRKRENYSTTSDGGGGGGGKNEFYLNLGVAVRTLREDLPALFVRDLDYDIYRDDITFLDPLNTFHGIENYRMIFWALRFHGRILFREINLEVLRIWQPSENEILIRWNLRGVPRVPWEARGQFQGTSRYKLDRNGKIYEHKVDNLAFNFPRMAMKPVTVLDLVAPVATCPVSPNLTFLGENRVMEDAWSCSWLELYRAVRETLDQEGGMIASAHDGLLLSCS